MNAMLDAFEESVKTENIAGSYGARQSLVPDPSIEADEVEHIKVAPDGRNRDRGQSDMTGSSGNKLDDLRMLRAENEAHQLANTNSVSALRMKAYMETSNEPFCKPLPHDSRWAEQVACCIIS